MGRVFMLFIFLVHVKYIFTEYNFIKLVSKSRIKKNLANFAITMLSSFVFLTIMYPLNLYYVFNKRFIASDLGEYSRGFWEAVSSFLYNIPLFFKTFILGIGNSEMGVYFGVFEHIDAHFKLISFAIFILTSIGVIYCFKNIKQFKSFFPLYLVIAYLFVLCISLVHTVDGKMFTTISIYRAFLIIIPIYLLAGHGIEYLKILSQGKNVLFVKGLYGGMILLIVAEISIHAINVRKMDKIINSFEIDLKTNNLLSLNSSEYNTENVLKGVLNQIYLKKIAEKIAVFVKNKGNVKDNTLIEIPLKQYTPQFLTLPSALHLQPFIKLYICLYMEDMDVSCNYLIDGSHLHDYSFRFPLRLQRGGTILVTDQKELLFAKKNLNDKSYRYYSILNL